MKRFVVTGPSTYGVGNAGDDAMFANLVAGLRREFQDCDITFVARHPSEAFDQAFNVRSIKNIDHDSKRASVGRWFDGFNPGDSRRHLRTVTEAIRECDAVIIGGNSFMEISPNNFMRGVASYSALFARWAMMLDKPYFLYGVAAHPAINGEITKRLARFTCGNAALVMVREDFTKQCLVDAGVTEHNLHVLADPAFGVDPVTEKDKGLEVLREEGIELGNRPTVGIGFRLLYWSWGEAEVEQYCARMAEICDAVVDELDAQILFIPNCTYDVDSAYEDDRFAARKVKEKMRHYRRAAVMEHEHLLPEILSVFPHLDMHVSNRRHSCVFAAVHGVPFVSLVTGMPMHIAPFMEAMGVAEQAVDMTAGDVKAITKKIMSTWNNSDSLKARMADRLPELRRQAWRYTALIRESLSPEHADVKATD